MYSFSLNGITCGESKIEIDGIKIYNQEWNFGEGLSFKRQYEKDMERHDKHKFKISCDIISNNEYNALILGKQKCSDALSVISFIYYSPNNIKPYFEPYSDIIEIPIKKRHMSQKILWPTELRNHLLNDLRNLSKKSANNMYLQRSLTWFREGYYSTNEYSEFLFN